MKRLWRRRVNGFGFIFNVLCRGGFLHNIFEDLLVEQIVHSFKIIYSIDDLLVEQIRTGSTRGGANR